jgi:hypothetical protein
MKIKLSFSVLLIILCFCTSNLFGQDETLPTMVFEENLFDLKNFVIPTRVFELENENQAQIELAISNDGITTEVNYKSGNRILFNLLKREILGRLSFDRSENKERRVILNFEFDEKSRTINTQPYNLALKVEKIKIAKDYPKHWKNGITKCPVHGEKLKVDLQPIMYGLILRLPTYFFSSDRKTLFPYTMDYIRGGCEIGQDKYMETTYCEKCRVARDEWVRNQTKKIPQRISN